MPGIAHPLLYGPGDPSQWATTTPHPILMFKGPVFGTERVNVVQHARCRTCSCRDEVFIEPFGFSGVEEPNLCGVPLIGIQFWSVHRDSDVESVTGYRCNTLADWVEAIKLSEVSSTEKRFLYSPTRKIFKNSHRKTIRLGIPTTCRPFWSAAWYGEKVP